LELWLRHGRFKHIAHIQGVPAGDVVASKMHPMTIPSVPMTVVIVIALSTGATRLSFSE
jgi:hypothetical protein